MTVRSALPPDGGVAVGTFIKTPAPVIVEILGTTGLDFAVLDGEHAPLDLATLDLLLIGGRAAGLPLLVRLPHRQLHYVQAALDGGAVGIVAPRIDTVEQAAEIVAAARFHGGTRGYSGATRAAGFGTHAQAATLALGDAALVICQIESPQACANAAAIAACPGVGGLLIGRADLSVAMNEPNASAAPVMQAALAVVRTVRQAGKIAGMAIASAAERAHYQTAGVNWFVISTDQSMLRQAAQSAARQP